MIHESSYTENTLWLRHGLALYSWLTWYYGSRVACSLPSTENTSLSFFSWKEICKDTIFDWYHVFQSDYQDQYSHGLNFLKNHLLIFLQWKKSILKNKEIKISLSSLEWPHIGRLNNPSCLSLLNRWNYRCVWMCILICLLHSWLTCPG